MSESKRTIDPWIARQLVGCDDALVGAGKMVYCDQKEKSLFGGVVLDSLATDHDNWEMAVGTLIFVPIQKYLWVANDGVCGWDMCDLISSGGLAPHHWIEKQLVKLKAVGSGTHG